MSRRDKDRRWVGWDGVPTDGPDVPGVRVAPPDKRPRKALLWTAVAIWTPLLLITGVAAIADIASDDPRTPVTEEVGQETAIPAEAFASGCTAMERELQLPRPRHPYDVLDEVIADLGLSEDILLDLVAACEDTMIALQEAHYQAETNYDVVATETFGNQTNVIAVARDPHRSDIVDAAVDCAVGLQGVRH